jgi:hypothetical protein
MLLPVQRFQTDLDIEFFAEKIQRSLMECCIKFYPNKPGSSHLNRKVEQSQKADMEGFYPTVYLNGRSHYFILPQLFE